MKNRHSRKKLHLSTVSEKRTHPEIKSLKRRNTAENSSILSKRLLIPKKSTQPLARPRGVGVLQIIKKFSPWRIMLEGKEPRDRKKILPWKGIPAKRILTKDMPDKLSRLRMSHSDDENPIPNDLPASRLNRRPEDKKKSKSRHLPANKRRTTFEETDNDVTHNIQGEDYDDLEISETPNDQSQSPNQIPFNFHNEILKDATDESSSKGTACPEYSEQRIIDSRYVYNVLGSHMDTLAKSCKIEEFWDSSAMIRSIQNSTLNILSQSIEEKERSNVSDNPPSVGQPFKFSLESVSSVGAVGKFFEEEVGAGQREFSTRRRDLRLDDAAYMLRFSKWLDCCLRPRESPFEPL